MQTISIHLFAIQWRIKWHEKPSSPKLKRERERERERVSGGKASQSFGNYLSRYREKYLSNSQSNDYISVTIEGLLSLKLVYSTELQRNYNSLYKANWSC